MNIKDQIALDLMDYADTGMRFNETEFQELVIKEPLNIQLYRGMYFPNEWINIDTVVEEWNGSTHWTPHIKIAKKFTNGCDCEDFVEKFGSNYGIIGYDESLKRFFTKTVFILDGVYDYLPLGNYLKEISLNNYNHDIKNRILDDILIMSENEYSLFDYNFIIYKIEYKDDLCYCYVKQIHI